MNIAMQNQSSYSIDPESYEYNRDTWISTLPKQNILKHPQYLWSNPQPVLYDLAKIIKDSKDLIHILDESDELGPSPTTYHIWKAGCEFLWRHATTIYERSDIVLETPLIRPTPHGGIGFLWNK